MSTAFLALLNQKPLSLIDTHCHLDFPQFDADRESAIAQAKNAGVERMITIGCRVDAAQMATEIASVNEGVFAAVGIHPTDVTEEFSSDFDVIQSLAEKEKVVAIGETGLDFFRPENPPKKDQIHSLNAHVDLAKTLEKPLIIHLRNANSEALEFLSKNHDFPFVVHCFAGDWSFAQQILDFGGMISFTGIITFKNVEPELVEVVRKAPLERIMIETDAPFLAPTPYRGKRNEPAYVVEVARKIAEIRGESFENIAKKTTENAEEFFGIYTEPR